MHDAATKLAIARTRLVMSKPFLGSLVLRLPLVAAQPEWCPAVATDARQFYYNARYIDGLSVNEVQFVLAHEALHCALAHFARRGHRIRRRWDMACDYAINPLLVRDGLKPPPGVIVMDVFDNMTAEEIYPCLDDNAADEPMDQHLYDEAESAGGSQTPNNPDADSREGTRLGEQNPEAGASNKDAQQSRDEREDGAVDKPPPLSAREREQLSQQWKHYLASAAQGAQAAGKLSGALARLAGEQLQPRLPWQALLAQYLTQAARDDYSYTRPSRREGDMIFPCLKSAQIELVIALDTSGSVSAEEFGQFLAEIGAIKGQLRAGITLLACDAGLAPDGPWRFEPWEDFHLPREFRGGGGTAFAPVFEWVAGRSSPPDVLVYFTDAEGEFPAEEPPYPVLWLVKGRASVPWGERIQLM